MGLVVLIHTRRLCMRMRVIAPAALCFAALMTTTEADAWCVTVPEANLRKGPGTNYEKSWEVYKYMPFQKIGQKGDWYQVRDLDGDEHWIHSTLVTNKMRCAAVKVDSANARRGPGTKHETLFATPMAKYYSLKVLEIRGDWVRVEDAESNKGWVYRPLVWIQ